MILSGITAGELVTENLPVLRVKEGQVLLLKKMYGMPYRKNQAGVLEQGVCTPEMLPGKYGFMMV